MNPNQQGILQMFAGNDPIQQALLQMQTQQPQVRPAPPAPPTPPPMRLSGPAPSAPPPSRPSSQGPQRQASATIPPAGPVVSPGVSSAIEGISAGLEQGPGSYYTGPGPAFAAALKAGHRSFVESKREQQAAEGAAAEEARFQQMLENPEVVEKLGGPGAVALLRGLGARAGIGAIQERLKTDQKIDPLSDKGVDQQARLERAKQEAEAIYRVPPNIDPLSRDGIAAQTELLNTRLRLEAELRERNIDPLSPEGIRAQQQLMRFRESIKPDPKTSLRMPPASVVTAVRGNENALEKLEGAIAALEANPNATTRWFMIPKMREMLGDTFGSEDNILTRSAIEGAGLSVIYDESGKQVNQYELRERGDIPRATDRPEVALRKLQRLRDMAVRGNDFLRSTYSPDFGFMSLPDKRLQEEIDTWNALSAEEQAQIIARGGRNPTGGTP